jgi:hypothetical protein
MDKFYKIRLEHGDGEFWYGRTIYNGIGVKIPVYALPTVPASGIVSGQLDEFGIQKRIDNSYRVCVTEVKG